MWFYSQSTGMLKHDLDDVACGYSGKAECKNVSADEDKPNLGPIPRGVYTFLYPTDSKTHGPFVLPLYPHRGNRMFGRSAFLMHGDSIRHPGDASEGCIIQSYETRIKVWTSGDHELTVTE